MCLVKKVLGIACFLFVSVKNVATSTDFTSNNVLVQFDLVQLPDWTNVVVEELKNVIAEFTNSYCNENKTLCEITETLEISSDNVIIEPGYPKLKDVNTLMLFHVSVYSTIRGSDISINKAALTDIVTLNRKEIQNGLLIAAQEPYEASFRISYVNDKLVLEMGDQTLNTIIIPIVCIVVLIMTALILGLEAKKRWKRNAEMKKIEEKHKERLLKN